MAYLRFDDSTLMFLNVCVKADTNLVTVYLKNALANCFFALDYLKRKKQTELAKTLTPFLKENLQRIARLAADEAMGNAPETIKKDTRPLWEAQKKFEEILVTLGGETYRDHLKHSMRDFWLGILLARIKNHWGLGKEKLGNFENSWYLIARFHDFCYILQSIRGIVQETENVILDAFQNLNFSMSVDISLGGYSMRVKHLELLKYLNPGKNVNSFITSISFLEQLENKSHNILSAFFIIDFLRSRNMIPKKFSEKDLKNIARAIALHTDSLTQAVLQPEEDYFAALMILVDEIQEWGRPTYKREALTIEEIKVNNLKVDFKENLKIQRFIDKILDSSGEQKFPELKFEIKEHFENTLVVEKKEDDFQVVLSIKIKNSKEFFNEIKKTSGEKRERLILENARNDAKIVISDLSSFATSIGLKAIQLKPDDIISSIEDKFISLEIPIVRKCKRFPINADRNLLCVILMFIFDQVSPYKIAKIPQLTYEDSSNKIIEWNIPNLKSRDIHAKKRNLYRLNTFKWDWGMKIISEPTYDKGKEQIFPVKKVEDL